MQSLMKSHRNYFEKSNKSSSLNIKDFILNQKKLSAKEKKIVFKLHNEAYDGETYGKKLCQYCRRLVKAGKISDNDVNRIFILSVDWPLHVYLHY